MCATFLTNLILCLLRMFYRLINIFCKSWSRGSNRCVCKGYGDERSNANTHRGQSYLFTKMWECVGRQTTNSKRRQTIDCCGATNVISVGISKQPSPMQLSRYTKERTGTGICLLEFWASDLPYLVTVSLSSINSFEIVLRTLVLASQETRYVSNAKTIG
jgi:hypothetical protein